MAKLSQHRLPLQHQPVDFLGEPGQRVVHRDRAAEAQQGNGGAARHFQEDASRLTDVLRPVAIRQTTMPALSCRNRLTAP
eukprot:scaffold30424_cov27-Prasinocladus_malaysianus.AAC.5